MFEPDINSAPLLAVPIGDFDYIEKNYKFHKALNIDDYVGSDEPHNLKKKKTEILKELFQTLFASGYDVFEEPVCVNRCICNGSWYLVFYSVKVEPPVEESLQIVTSPVTQSLTVESDPVKEKPKKRKRGRPRKNPVPVTA